MANAKMCDRCGRYYNFYNTDTRNAANTIGKHRLTCGGNDTYQVLFDVCPECLNEFDIWLKEKQNDQV